MTKKTSNLYLSVTVFSLMALTALIISRACFKPDTGFRKYQEISIEPTSMAIAPFPVGVKNTNISWQTPPTWDEFKGEGFRLVTFRSREAEKIECSIVSLSGAAGGLEANLTRWMNQIKLTPLSDEKLKEFLKMQKRLTTPKGDEIILVDLALLQADDPASTPSILGAVLPLPDETIFIKMTGTKSALSKERENFEKLCQSLNLPK